MFLPPSNVDEARDGTLRGHAPRNSDEEEENRRPVRAFGYARNETRLLRRDGHRAKRDGKRYAAQLDRERAEADKGATAHLVIAGRAGVVAVIGMAGRMVGGWLAMVHHPRAGEAVQSALAVP